MSRSEQGHGLGRRLVSSEAWRYFAEFYRRRMARLLLYGCVAALQAILVVLCVMSWQLLLVAHSRSTYEIRDRTLHRVSSPTVHSATG